MSATRLSPALRRLALAAAGVVVLGGALPGQARSPSPKPYRALRTVQDSDDVGGPLDIVSATAGQEGDELSLTVTTTSRWTPRALGADRRRGLCALVSTPGSAATLKACFRQRGSGDSLALAWSAGGSRGQAAAARGADGRSASARVPLAAVGLAPGEHRFKFRSAWVGGRSCQPAAPCVDVAPDGTADASLTVEPVRPLGCTRARGAFVTAGPTGRKAVALTFDDGPSPYTGPLLGELERRHVPATFFVLGRELAGRGELLRRELRDGDVIGDHSWAHPVLSGGGPFATRQLESTRVAIEHDTGFATCLFRAPYGRVSPSLIEDAGRLGMSTIQWNVDPRDWSMPGADAIARRVIGAVRPGSIVLLHDGGGPRGETVAAVPRIVDALRARGYRFETVPALLGGGIVYGRR